jgi:hypothetical protein
MLVIILKKINKSKINIFANMFNFIKTEFCGFMWFISELFS